jgi:hypothetical protein
MTKAEKKAEEFIKLSEPLIKWLNDNFNPHSSIEITSTSAELKIGEMSHYTEKFIKD